MRARLAAAPGSRPPQSMQNASTVSSEVRLVKLCMSHMHNASSMWSAGRLVELCMSLRVQVPEAVAAGSDLERERVPQMGNGDTMPAIPVSDSIISSI